MGMALWGSVSETTEEVELMEAGRAAQFFFYGKGLKGWLIG